MEEGYLGFKKASQRLVDEKKSRALFAKNKLSFGIGYLDKALSGIFQNDLIVVGAPTGSGKTECVTSIARHNALAGKRVYFFALEAYPDEIERRVKYKSLAIKYFADGNKEPISFQDWLSGDVNLDKYESDIKANELDNLFTFYNTGDFSIQHLVAAYNALAGKADLIILDHLHFIDFEDDASNSEMKSLLKAIKKMADITNIPCIAVSHLRKRDSSAKKDIPELDDFHGSSDITKIATKTIILQGAGIDDEGNCLTYIHAAKNRMGGDRTKYLAILKFDPLTNSYLNDVAIRAVKDGKIDKAPSMPYWMRR
jgi:replicative DNA helicase